MSKQPDSRKKRLFTLVAVLFPFILILLFEMSLRLFNYGGNQKLFVTGPEEQISHFWMCNPNVGKRYFYMLDFTPSPPKDLFLKIKPENGYRIFVLGGSTTAGFPYGYNLMFPRILQFQLSELFPDKHIEVVNTAMSAVNSHTLVDFMDEILEQQPDAILVYAGHNEYYGAMGVGSQESFSDNPAFINAYMKLRTFRIFQLVRNAVGSLRQGVSKVTSGGTDIDPTNTMMARIVREQKIPYKSDMYNQGLQQFDANMRRIIEKAQQQNVPILISELVSNVKDQPPFISIKDDSLPTAEKAFSIGTKLLQQGDVDDARTALNMAKDVDALRFRASEELNEMIRSLGREYNVPVVPMLSAFETHARDNIIGNELILEHLHPNAFGYFIMADAFLNTMRTNGLVSSVWDADNIRPMHELMANWGWTEIDTASAALSIHYLKGGWPFQPEIQPNHALQNYFPKTRAESLSVRILTEKQFSVVVGHVDMGSYYESQGEYEKAFREFKAAYYTIPNEMEFYEKAVTNLLRLQDYQQAYDVLKLSFRYGSSALTNKWMGQLLVGQQRYSEALPFLQTAYDKLPEDKQVIGHLATSLDVLGESQQAAELRDAHGITQADGVDPASSQLLYTALLKQGQQLLQEKEYEKALPILKKAHAIKPDIVTFRWIGMVDLAVGNIEEGVAYLEKVVRDNPDDFQTHYNLVNGYITLGQKDQAKATIRQMEKIRPNFNDPQKIRRRVEEM